MWSLARFSPVFGKSLWLARSGGALFLAGSLFSIPLHAQIRGAGPPDSGRGRVSQISLKGSGETIEVEIHTTGDIIPESQSVSSPDRIIVDFPGALPSAELRSMQFNYGVLKGIRAGLFSANPPITRVVFDLAEPEPYQIVTHDNTVTVKFRLVPTASRTSEVAAIPQSQPGNAIAAVPAANQPAPPPTMTVNFQHGLLRIHAKGATLAQVLFEVQTKTGAEIPIPSGAEKETVAADLGPAPPREVLAALLNGSRYNFIFIDDDHGGHTLQKAILSLR